MDKLGNIFLNFWIILIITTQKNIVETNQFIYLRNDRKIFQQNNYRY